MGRSALALLMVLALALPAFAQEQRGSIEGTVRDSSGAVLPGVTVEARAGVRGVVSTVTDESGVYRFPALMPGTYEVSADLSGFNSNTLENVSVSLGQILRVDLTLQPQGITETVSVTAEAPLIDVKQSASFANIRNDIIDNIPKARDFTSLVQLAPGANDEPKSGGLSIDGASGAENRFYIDGTDSTNLRMGVSGKDLVTDFVEELQVKSSGYPAEFRGATGGVINVITKSGSNDWTGYVGSLFSSDNLEGSERPTLRLVLTGENQSEYVTFPKDDFRRIEPLAQLGGPIVRNRLWFFGGYSPSLEETDRTVTFRADGQTRTLTQTQREHYATGNVTAQLTNSLRGRFSVTANPYYEKGRLPDRAGTDAPDTNYAINREQPNTSYAGQVDYVVTPRLFLAGRANFLTYDTTDEGIPADLRHIFNGSNAVFPETPPSLVRDEGFTSGASNRAVLRDLYQRTAVGADATYYASLAGQHQFKGGFLFEQIRNDVFDAEQSPNVTFFWDQSLTTLDGRTVRGQYGHYRYRQFGTQGDVRARNYGLFIQDLWTVNNRLTLSLGLRTEREEIPSYVEGLSGIEFGFGDKIDPRVGFAWDVRGDGTWKAYGSWGRFHDIFKLELPRGAFGGDKWLDYRYSLDTLDWTEIGVNENFPGEFYEVVNFRIPSNDPSCPECGGIDPNLKPYQTRELTLGVEHELNPTMSLGVRYVNKRVDRAVEDVGVIVPGLGEVFFTANPGFGIAEHIIGDEFPALPKAVRDYDSVELRLTKRFSHNFSADAVYLWSRLDGNYPGLASSDEVNASGDGRRAPNVNRLFDAIVMAFDENAQAVFGPLETDRPHQLKLSGYYTFPFGSTVGAFFRAQSGTPISRRVSMVSSTPVFYQGRGSDGRSSALTRTDLFLAHRFSLGSHKLQLEMNVDNLFDQETVTRVFPVETRQILPIEEAEFFQGFDTQQLIAEHDILRDPRFLQDEQFQGKRAIRFGVKFLF
ncbi:MAG: hypothetical protein GEU99_04300 [Luteitalea sp.]|nr:hypothetical protein [Luteitalea sp.]